MSGEVNIKGSNQLPNPPTIIGITKKKIIIKAWAVTITLYKCSSPIKPPGRANSKRINNLSLVPTNPDQKAKIIYNVPISLWLVLPNHRWYHHFLATSSAEFLTPLTVRYTLS